MSDRYLIVGLGNPGAQYAETRHNVGFMAVEALGRAWDITGKSEAKFKAIVGSGRAPIQGRSISVILAQPTTFMNLSGEAVQLLMQYYQVPAAQLLVIYDDVALPLGKIRLRSEGSAGGQNGMKSIIQSLGGNQAFARLRIGIGAPKIPGIEGAMTRHVLSRFESIEKPWIDGALVLAESATVCWLTEGIEKAMTAFNGRSVEISD